MDKEKSTEQKKRFLFVSDEGLIGDLAWEVTKEGHEVLYYIKEKAQKDVCEGFVQKTDDWQEKKDWADVIIFDDVVFGQTAETLRKQGKLVFGGSVYADKLEMDREFGQEEMKSLGINILPKWNFSDFDAAIDFIQKNPGRYVIKPSGHAQGEKELSFVGQEEDGKDIIQVLEHYKKHWSKKIKEFQLQKFVSGVEIAVGAFFNGKEFVKPVFVNFEHKKMFPGNIGVSTGEMGTLGFWADSSSIFDATAAKFKEKLAQSGYVGYFDINCIVNNKGIYPLEMTCFSEDTEILTKNDGWKLIKDVRIGETVATLNPKTHKLEYQDVINTISKKHAGHMINICGAGKNHEAINCLVTPDHQMYIEKRNGQFDFVRADKIPQGSKIKRDCKWNGKNLKNYVVPEYTENHYLGKHKKIQKIKHSKVVMPVKCWLKFLGIFLAEGSIGGNGHHVGISQYSKKKEVKELLRDFPFKVSENKNGFQISSTQLVKHLLSFGFGKANTKYVPEYVKSLPPKQIKIFLDSFRIGDGNIHKRTKQVSYFSTSKRLMEDIQELLLKCGIVGNIRKINAKGTKMKGYKYFRNHDLYWISERTKKTNFYVDKRNIKKSFYKGKVHCVEVPNHIIYVRRQGKAFWCGNCRFGYPTISLQIEGINSKWGDILYNLAKGEPFNINTKKGFQLCVVVAVPPFPFTDPASFKKYSEEAVVLFKKPINQGVHLGDVKFVENDWRLAGYSGYALVITDSATTVDDARKQVYNKIANIMIPNMFYRTDIGLGWPTDSDKLLTWGYLH